MAGRPTYSNSCWYHIITMQISGKQRQHVAETKHQPRTSLPKKTRGEEKREISLDGEKDISEYAKGDASLPRAVLRQRWPAFLFTFLKQKGGRRETRRLGCKKLPCFER